MPAQLHAADGFAGKGDDFYANLLSAHDGLSDLQSAKLHVRLVLLLANHIGNLAVIEEALSAARRSVLHEAEHFLREQEHS